MTKTPYTILGEKNSKKSTREIDIEISTQDFTREYTATLDSLAANTEIHGFRKGKAPAELVLKSVGEMEVLEKAANNVIHDVIFAVLMEKQLRFIGQPSVSITKLAKNNPLQFKMSVVVAPEFSLPDYKSIAATENKKKETEPSVTDAELAESLQQIQKILGRQKGDQNDQKPVELTDAEVNKLGNFSSVAEFTERLKADLLTDKKNRAREKKMLEIIETIVAKTDVELPDALVENELDSIESEFSHDVERMNMKFDDYLVRIKKTKDELRKEWQGNAEKRAKFELILPKLAHAENMTVHKEDVERETAHLIEHNSGSDKESAKLYVEHALLRQKVLQFLEQQK